MTVLRNLLRRDVLIALCVLALSGFTTGYLFDTINGERELQRVSIDGIAAGEVAYVVQSRGNCVGRFTTNLVVSRETSELQIKGRLKMLFEHNEVVPELDANIFFNNLGQMGSSIFRLKTGDFEVVFGTDGLRKMKAVLRTLMNGITNRIEIPLVAGPFLLSRTSSGDYQIGGPLPDAWTPMQQNRAYVPMITMLQLSVAEAGDGAKECSIDAMSPLNLTPLLAPFRNLLRL